MKKEKSLFDIITETEKEDFSKKDAIKALEELKIYKKRLPAFEPDVIK